LSWSFLQITFREGDLLTDSACMAARIASPI